MTDYGNDRIYALITELVRDAPPPPPFPEDQLVPRVQRPKRTRTRIGGPLTAVATLAVVLLFGGLSAVLLSDNSGDIEGTWRLAEYETDSGMATVTPDPDSQALMVTIHQGRFSAQDACMPISGSYVFDPESSTLETSDLVFDMLGGACPTFSEEERVIALALLAQRIEVRIDRDRMVWIKEYQSFEGPVVKRLILERVD